MKKSHIFTLLCFFVFIPLTLYFGDKIPGRNYYITGTLIILEILIPFLLMYEGKKPSARELVLCAVMSAIAIVSRLAIPVPHFKPVFAVILLSGIALGPETGFMIGAITAFGSNFFAGQGAFTPWQMFAYGAGGMLAGFLGKYKVLTNKAYKLGIMGFIINLLFIGPLLDLSTIFIGITNLTIKSIGKILLAGVSINILQSICTLITMILLGKPFLKKINRVKTKYGL